MRSLIFLSIFFFNFLQASFYDRAMEGRYWYDEEESLEEEKPVITKENAAEELIKVREKLDTAKALAILAPTKQNIRHYMILQKEVVENAENFSQVWAHKKPRWVDHQAGRIF